MIPHLRYLWYVLRHKWFVFVAGRVLGVPLRQLLAHDLSKFSRAEWGPYVAYQPYFACPNDAPPWIKRRFQQAWEHHWHANPHHPEHWKAREHLRDPFYTVDSPWMPDIYVREMVADWYGAGMAQGKPDCWAWYRANRDRYPFPEVIHHAVRRYLTALTDAGLIPQGTYTLRYDRVDPDGVLDGAVTLPGHLSLAEARAIYAAQCVEYARIGYRTAHACVIGPRGEVTAAVETNDGQL